MAKYEHFEQTPAWFRNQLDRAALSVSNNIAEGFDRHTTNELEQLLGTARGSASKVRSISLVVHERPGLAPAGAALPGIIARAESCARQLTGWIAAVQVGPVQGRRTLGPPPERPLPGEAHGVVLLTSFSVKPPRVVARG